MGRPRRALSDTERRDLTALLGRGRPLQPLERGKLRALARHGTPEQQAQADAKLNRPTAKQVGDAIVRVLADGE
jgi:hypothetical protein